MTLRSGWRRIAALVAFCLVPSAPAAAAIDLVGRTSARFEWAPAPGPVNFYFVDVSRDGGEFERAAVVAATVNSVLIEGSYGTSIQVRVRAGVSEGELGDYSELSEVVRFVDPGLPAEEAPQVEAPSPPVELPRPDPTAPSSEVDGSASPDSGALEVQEGMVPAVPALRSLPAISLAMLVMAVVLALRAPASLGRSSR